MNIFGSWNNQAHSINLPRWARLSVRHGGLSPYVRKQWCPNGKSGRWETALTLSLSKEKARQPQSRYRMIHNQWERQDLEASVVVIWGVTKVGHAYCLQNILGRFAHTSEGLCRITQSLFCKMENMWKGSRTWTETGRELLQLDGVLPQGIFHVALMRCWGVRAILLFCQKEIPQNDRIPDCLPTTYLVANEPHTGEWKISCHHRRQVAERLGVWGLKIVRVLNSGLAWSLQSGI